MAIAGTFCLNTACEHYGILQEEMEEENIIKFGRTPRGVQRYRCKSCLATFTATRGTLFYRRRTPTKDILETLALLAEGVRIRSLAQTRLRAARGLLWPRPRREGLHRGVLEQLKKRRRHRWCPPAVISDGWGGYAEAMLEVWGEVPE